MAEFSWLYVSALYQALVKGRKLNSPVCKTTVRDLNKLLKSAFRQAVIWGVLDRSSMEKISIPKERRQRNPAWDSVQVWQAVFACNNDRNLSIVYRLRLIVHYAFEVLTVPYAELYKTSKSPKNPYITAFFRRTHFAQYHRISLISGCFENSD